MTKEQLDALLAEGKITQEEYDAKLAELESGTQQSAKAEDFLESETFKGIIDKAAQSAADRVRTEYAKKLKEKEQELAAIKAAQMTEEERKEEQLRLEREALEAERAELSRLKVENFATKALAEKKLPTDVLEFVMADNEDNTSKRIENFMKLLDSQVQVKVEAEFAKHGYVPGGGSTSKTVKNPFASETFNLTEQGKLFKENPELARKLAAQAGIKL